MSFVKCRACGEDIKIEEKAKIGYIVICPVCQSDFVIVSLDPPEIDWPMMEDSNEYDNGYEDFDDFDEDDFEDNEEFDDDYALAEDEDW